MSDNVVCSDRERLVAYLYDECDAHEHDAMASHLSACAACSEALASLVGTRQALDRWSPPEVALGFQISPAAYGAGDVGAWETGAGVAVRSSQWWRQPLPAWLQIAAAVMIFAAGMSIGQSREASGARAAASRPAASPVQTAATDNRNLTAADLARLEERLRADMVPRPEPVAAVAPPDEAIMRQVRDLITQSEQRQGAQLDARSRELTRFIDVQRADDLARVQQVMGRFQGATGAEVSQQREAIKQMYDYLRVNVSQSR